MSLCRRCAARLHALDRPFASFQPAGLARLGQLNALRFIRFLLLDVVMFVGVLFCLVQFLDGLVDVFHGCDAVAAPFSAGVFEIVAGALQGAAGRV